MKGGLRWRRATTIYPTDHIVSSQARESGIVGFKPEYEKTKHINMNFLMSDEYMRLWFKQRDFYMKETYSKAEVVETNVYVKRAYVQRMGTQPKVQRQLPFINLKRFQNIISKVDNRRSIDEKNKICRRYQKTFEPVQLGKYKPACPPLGATDNKTKQKAGTSTQDIVTCKKLVASDQKENCQCPMVFKLT